MAKVTTCRDIENYARREGKTLKQVAKEWEIVVFVGAWTPANEVLVPNNMPVPGKRLPGIIII